MANGSETNVEAVELNLSGRLSQSHSALGWWFSSTHLCLMDGANLRASHEQGMIQQDLTL